MGARYLEKKTIKIKSSIKEYCSNLKILEDKDSGKKEKSILEPSKGGMGTKLNIPNAKFITTIIEVIK